MASVASKLARGLDPEAVARARAEVVERARAIAERGWPKRVDWATARQIGVEAHADPRTVHRELANPGCVNGAVGERVRRALEARYGKAVGA